jgi:hypothetical protein
MDRRDAVRNEWYESLNNNNMIATVVIEDDNGDEVTVHAPFKYEICDVCDGKGKHVNPNIDRHGLTSEDFSDDPDFAENYFNGNYDVTCNCCAGSRVTPVYDEERANSKVKEQMKQYFHHIEELHRYDREDAYTRFMENGGHY